MDRQQLAKTDKQAEEARAWLLGTAEAGMNLLAAIADMAGHERTADVARAFRRCADAFGRGNPDAAERAAGHLSHTERGG
jgi:hypothetical protein